jgi:glycine/D-amino acid oxidase-like deaminating enzyme
MSLSIPLSPFQGDEDFPSKADVVVIGGGIIGVNTALTLAERGVSVVLVEKGVIGGEQSARNWGWTRQMGRDAAELPLTMASLRLWSQMNERIGAETGWRRTGITYLCYNKRDMDIWGGWYDEGKAYGLDSQMLTGQQVSVLLPGSSGGLIGGLHTPSDGRAEPAIAAVAMANAARRAGARILTQCAARGVERSAGKISAVVTERGRIACSSVVLAGGVWSRLFAGNMGLDFPQLKVMGTVARVTGVEGISDMPVAASDFSYRKRLDGDYTVALRNANIANIVPDSFRLFAEYMPSFVQTWRELKLRVGKAFMEEMSVPRSWSLDQQTPFEAVRTLDPVPEQSFNRKALAKLAQAYPAFAKAKIVNEWAGMMDVTPDAVPVISEVASVPGFHIASGFSGHGFGIGPGAGQLMADIVMGATPLVDPKPFHISRLRPNFAKAA